MPVEQLTTLIANASDEIAQLRRRISELKVLAHANSALLDDADVQVELCATNQRVSAPVRDESHAGTIEEKGPESPAFVASLHPEVSSLSEQEAKELLSVGVFRL
jgi:hypothetical protein